MLLYDNIALARCLFATFNPMKRYIFTGRENGLKAKSPVVKASVQPGVAQPPGTFAGIIACLPKVGTGFGIKTRAKTIT